MIFAYKYGPVIKSVYDVFKKTDYSILSVEDDSLEYDEKEKRLPIRSRIIASEYWVDKIKCIDKIIDLYGGYSAKELVGITHRNNSPWSNTKQGDEIGDDIILRYHVNERV